MSGRELTINVTEFKARCSQLLDDVGAGRLARIHVSKRGKPLAVISGAAPKAHFQKLYGCMRGRTRALSDVDLTAPILDEDWEYELLKEWDELHG